MKAKKDKVRSIFAEAFHENPAWTNWFFENVYDEDDALLLTRGGNAVSALMLQRYAFNFYGQEVPMAYIYGAATTAVSRGKGCMTELMTMALNASYERGDLLASLIPANRNLYFFYDKFGFATTVYFDAMRYTSVHTFDFDDTLQPVPLTYELMHRLELRSQNTILHTPSQFEALVDDIGLENGIIAAVESHNGDGRAAVAFVYPSEDDSEYMVRALMATDAEAAESALAQALCDKPKLPVVVWANPWRQDVMLNAHGMMRIVNVHKALSAVAAHSPSVNQVIRVHDGFIAANNGVYLLHDGHCEHVDATMRRLTLDVSVSTLTAILFSAPQVGHIFGLPTERAALPLMLD